MSAAIPTEMTWADRIREVVRLARVHHGLLVRLQADEGPATDHEALEMLDEIAERLVALILDPPTLCALAPCSGPFLGDAAVRV